MFSWLWGTFFYFSYVPSFCFSTGQILCRHSRFFYLPLKYVNLNRLKQQILSLLEDNSWNSPEPLSTAFWRAPYSLHYDYLVQRSAKAGVEFTRRFFTFPSFSLSFLRFFSSLYSYSKKKKKKSLNSFFWILELVKCRFQLKELHAIRTRIYHRLKLANLSQWSSQFLMGWLPDSFWFRSTFRSLKW